MTVPVVKKRRRGFFRRVQQSERFMNTVGAAISGHIRFVYRTSRVFRHPSDLDRHLLENSPSILATWHGQFVMIPAFKPKTLPTSVMVARHADGEMIARAIRGFDMGLIRGAGAGESGKDKGGMEALRAAVQALRSGTTLAMTADVPPGPARVAGLGIIMIARISGRPIIPVAPASNRLLTFPTWSRLTLCLPFSKLSAVAGEPIFVPRNADGVELEVYRRRLETELNAVTARAFELVGTDMSRVSPPSLQPPPKSGFLLRGYRGLTTVARPVAMTILRRRAARGKEITARLPERLGEATVARPAGALLWFHAASVGETNAILPVIHRVQSQYPQANILLTTVTVTASQIAKARLPVGAIHQFLPLDNLVFVRRFLDHWKPDLGVFTESEIWPNLIVEAANRAVPLILVNARMSQKSAKRWKMLSSLSKPVFSRFDLALAQDARIAKRLKQLGVRRAEVTGNIKYDAPPPPVDLAAHDHFRAQIAGRPVFLAASTHPGEDEVIIGAHALLKVAMPNLLTVIAPRHPLRGDSIASLLAATGLSFARRSHGKMVQPDTDVYLADTIGEMGLLYASAPVSFIGGSLVPQGGQNPIEAIKLGSGIVNGPHTYNFAETYDALQKHGGSRLVSNAEDLAAILRNLFENTGETQAMKRQASIAIAGLSGALEKTLTALQPYVSRVLSEPPVSQTAALHVADHAA